jgi:hypothetical protein
MLHQTTNIKIKEYRKEQMNEVIKGTKGRMGFVLRHGRSFLFRRNRKMIQSGEPKPENLRQALDRLTEVM